MSEIKPLHYKLHLEPDLKSFRFDGKAEIEMETSGPVQTIPLNGLELAIWNCRVANGKKEMNCAFAVDPLKESLTVQPPSELNGRITLKIDYAGVINNRKIGRASCRERV